MRVVVDTNVLVSGVFFSGFPRRILEAWRDERVELVVSLVCQRARTEDGE